MRTQTVTLKCACFFTLKLFFIFLFPCSLCLQANAQTIDDSLAGRVNGVWWVNNNILTDAAAFARMNPDELATASTTPTQIKSTYPATVGVFASLTWESLAGTYNPITGPVYNSP